MREISSYMGRARACATARPDKARACAMSPVVESRMLRIPHMVQQRAGISARAVLCSIDCIL